MLLKHSFDLDLVLKLQHEEKMPTQKVKKKEKDVFY